MSAEGRSQQKGMREKQAGSKVETWEGMLEQKTSGTTEGKGVEEG